jgi:hypothetical protein
MLRMLLNDDREGTGWVPDLTLIDSGWKNKQWGTEPVHILAAQAGFRGIQVSGKALAQCRLLCTRTS